MRRAIVLALVLLATVATSSAQASSVEERKQVICKVFGRYCSQALAVARCESGWSYSLYASNGQYQGMFQMGSSERSRYGHGSNHGHRQGGVPLLRRLGEGLVALGVQALVR